MKHSLSVNTCAHYIFIGMLLFFSIVSQVHAQNRTLGEVDHGQMSPEEMRTMPIAENTPVRESMRDAQKTMLSSQRQDRIINLASNITSRLDAATTRFADITARLYTRIEKLRVLGVDTSLAEAKLNEAKDLINTAGNTLAQMGSLRTIVSSDSPREAFATVRTQFLDIRASLMQAHALLRETVALLKEAVQKAESARGVSSAVTDIQPSSENASSTN